MKYYENRPTLHAIGIAVQRLCRCAQKYNVWILLFRNSSTHKFQTLAPVECGLESERAKNRSDGISVNWREPLKSLWNAPQLKITPSRRCGSATGPNLNLDPQHKANARTSNWHKTHFGSCLPPVSSLLFYGERNGKQNRASHMLCAALLAEFACFANSKSMNKHQYNRQSTKNIQNFSFISLSFVYFYETDGDGNDDDDNDEDGINIFWTTTTTFAIRHSSFLSFSITTTYKRQQINAEMRDAKQKNKPKDSNWSRRGDDQKGRENRGNNESSEISAFQNQLLKTHWKHWRNHQKWVAMHNTRTCIETPHRFAVP